MAVQTIKRSGSRFYFDTRAPDHKVPGVTSIVGMLPKPFLGPWNAKETAVLAVDSLAYIKEMAARDREGAIDYLKGAARRYTNTRAKVGSDAHDMFERMVRGDYVGRVHPDLEPYKRNFAEFLETVQPELVGAEDVAWSDAHDYAGSFDATLKVKLDDNGRLHPQGDVAHLMTDWKTGKNTYPDVALQMSAYAHADRIISADGTSRPMPIFDGAAVLHITPDQWAFKPVRIDRDDVFATFLRLREIFDWDRDISKTVLGKPIASGGGDRVTGTQRRAR